MKQTEVLTPMDVTQVGNYYLADLTDAEATNVTATTSTIDVGFTPVAGGGIEITFKKQITVRLDARNWTLFDQNKSSNGQEYTGGLAIFF